LQVGLQIAVAVMVCGALLMLLVIHFIRRDGIRIQPLMHFMPTRRLISANKKGGPKARLFRSPVQNCYYDANPCD